MRRGPRSLRGRHGGARLVPRRVLAALVLAVPARAQAAPLRVLGTGAVEHAAQEVAAAFTRATGRGVTLSFGNAGAIAVRLRGGEAADLVINSAVQIEALAQAGLVDGGSRAELGRMRIGLAVRAGAPMPDIATPAGLEATLRAAPVIAYSDGSRGATTGVHLDRMLAAMGLGADGPPKRLLYQQGITAVEAVAAGQATLVMTQTSEIIAVPGARLVGPLPESLQLVTPYVGAVATRAADPTSALALLQAMLAPAGAAVFRHAGFRVG